MATRVDSEQRYVYAALSTRLWAAITEPERLSHWLGPVDLQPVPGHRFGLHPHVAGLAEEITGQVTGVDVGARLEMVWHVGGADLLVSWQVSREPGGCGLRVVRGAVPDPDQEKALAAFLHTAFTTLLPTYLRNTLLMRRSLVPEPTRLADTPPDYPVPDGDLQPLTAGPVRWRRCAVAAAALVVGLMGVTWLLWPVKASDADATGFMPSFGVLPNVAPGADSTPTMVTGTAAATASAALPSADHRPQPPAASAGAAAVALPPPAVAPLTVAATTTSRQMLQYTVRVTISNPATRAQDWRNVGVTLTGASLMVATQGPVTHHRAGQLVCFTPTGTASTVSGTATLTFTFTVTAVSGSAGSAGDPALDVAAC